jgi:nitrogen-specific signal transduction histidine kinase
MFCREAALALRVEQLREQQFRKIQSERAGASIAVARKVVHEVNNPLGIVKNYLKILGIKLKDQAIGQDEIRILNEEIDRITHILGRLTAVSRETSRKLTLVDINALLRDLVKLTAESLMRENKIAVHADLDPTLPKLLSETGGLKQIFLNLMKNATEAMKRVTALESECAAFFEARATNESNELDPFVRALVIEALQTAVSDEIQEAEK